MRRSEAGEQKPVEVVFKLRRVGTDPERCQGRLVCPRKLSRSLMLGNLGSAWSSRESGLREEVSEVYGPRPPTLMEVGFKAARDGSGCITALAENLLGGGGECDVGNKVLKRVAIESEAEAVGFAHYIQAGLDAENTFGLEQIIGLRHGVSSAELAV